jgi:hypothetical protein
MVVKARQLPINDRAETWHDPLPVAVPAFSRDQVYAALDPGEAVEAVREAFLEHARGSWAMPSKV